MDSYGAKLRIFPLIKNWIRMKIEECEKCLLNENIWIEKEFEKNFFMTISGKNGDDRHFFLLE